MNKSLRRQKKEATASAMAEAAFQLAMERGLEGFVVEDIVQKAGYSRRTFANHFSCKEEAVVTAAEVTQGYDEYLDMIHQLPEDTVPLEVMYQFIKMKLSESVLWRIHQIMELSKINASLVPYTLSMLHRLQTAAQETLDDLFKDRYPVGYNHFLAGSVCSIILPMLDGSINVRPPGAPVDDNDGIVSFEEYIDTAFNYLRNGF